MTHGTTQPSSSLMITWGGRVAKLKKIEYLFKRVKPNKARRVPSLSLGQVKVIDYATLEGVAWVQIPLLRPKKKQYHLVLFFLLFCFAGFEGEAVLNGLPGDDQIRRLTEDRSPRTNPAIETK